MAATALLVMLCLAPSAAGSRRAPRPPEMPVRQRPPGEGVICALGISSAMAEVGRRCVAHRDEAFQAELERAVTQIDAYVLRNSSWTPADLDRFKHEQAGIDAPVARLCRSDIVGMYRDLASRGSARLREENRRLLARPGTPTWGTCL